MLYASHFLLYEFREWTQIFLIKYICFSLLWNYTTDSAQKVAGKLGSWMENGKSWTVWCRIRAVLIPAVCFSSSDSTLSRLRRVVLSKNCYFQPKFPMHLPYYYQQKHTKRKKHFLSLAIVVCVVVMCSNFNSLKKVVKLSVIWSCVSTVYVCVWLIITKCAFIFIMHTKLLLLQIK